MRCTPRLLRHLAAAVVVAVVPLTLDAAPYTPAGDDVVIERLPLKPRDPAAAELKKLRAASAREPNHPLHAARLARAYVKRYRLEADPRYLGYAQAALSPWWNQARAPADILVLRAVIHQAGHRFDNSLADLERALALDARNAQAWLTRASIEQVRGDYAAARMSCSALAPLTNGPAGQACLATVAGLNGSLAQGYALLRRVADEGATSDPYLRAWIHALLADMSARGGDAATAERHYTHALSAGAPDGYLLASYADFLLDQRRDEEVIALLHERTRPDALLLRLAIAEHRLHTPDAARHIAELRDRFEASRLRGDVLHRREEAMFHLYLLGDAHTALRLARDNWDVQREPPDARILLAAALAAKSPHSARPVTAWLAKTRLQDLHIERLVQTLAGRAS